MTRRVPRSAPVNARSVINTAQGTLGQPVLDALRCSVCGDRLAAAGRSLRCPAGHCFDIAKQGYVNLLHAKVPSGTADTAQMVAARVAFLGAGHYAPLADAVTRAASDAVAGPGLVVDAGAGTGYYLAAVLEALPKVSGLALDLSPHALRRAARAHPRLAAAVWNVWRPLPVASGCAALVLNIFAPRNGAEYRRILRPDGALLVVTPNQDHLAELAGLTDLLDVDPDKDRRVAATLAEHFRLVGREHRSFRMSLSAAEIRALIGMGPSAHHTSAAALDHITRALDVTASCTVAVYRPRGEVPDRDT